MNFALFQRRVDLGLPERGKYLQNWPEFQGDACRHDEIHRVLDGDGERLLYAFTWVKTHQGEMYWKRRRQGDERITEEDRDYMVFLLDTVPDREMTPRSTSRSAVW